MTILGNKKKIWTYFFEFLVLFASIYIAFELEEWDEEQDFTDREEAYLASMHQDLSKDINSLNRRVLEYDEKIEGALQTLELLEGSYAANRSSVFDIFQRHLQYNFNYEPVNNTLETLKTSGDLKLIKNHGFKILLSELDKSYSAATNQGNIFNNYVEGSEWSGFFINNYDLKDLRPMNEDPHLRTLFQNKIRHYIFLIENYYFSLQGSLKKIEEVKLALESEMSRRQLSFNPGNDNNDDLESRQAEDSLTLEINDLLDEINPDGKEKESSGDEQASDSIDSITDDLLDELPDDFD